MKSKHVVVLGLGTFGAAVVQRLRQNKCRVTGVDRHEARVEELRELLDEAVVADVTDRKTLEQLHLEAADAVFIGLGEQFERSILTALHLKELGIRRVHAKGVTPEHGRILEALGVEQVIYPEADIAVVWADRVTWPNVLERLSIDPEYGLVEIAVPNALAGKTLAEVDLRRKYGLSVVGVKDVLFDKLVLIPPGEFQLTGDQLLIVIGKQEDVNRFQELQ